MDTHYLLNKPPLVKSKKMNCKEAKLIDIVSYIKKLGLEPENIKGNSTWFLSLFRIEKTASFKVDTAKNLWYDFGDGIGGTIIDLVMYLNNCSIKEALKILSNDTFLFHRPVKLAVKEKRYSIDKVIDLENKNLLDYINKRKLNLAFARQFCCQVHYTFTNKKQAYGIGFMNDIGGFEIRNEAFKGCLGKKSITSILNNSNTLSLFESWSDFLSYLTLKNNIPDEDFVILNSTSMVKNIIGMLKKYTIIKLQLDLDIGGKNAAEIIKGCTTNKVIDNSIHYSNFNDLNDYLMNRKN